MKKNALYTYAVRLPRGLMTPLFLKTTLRVKWVSFLRNLFPGAAYLRKIESFMEDHFIRGELLMKFCRGACLQRGDLQSLFLVF